MAIGMPVFMLYVLWGAPSGLLLYWLVGNMVGFSQQFIINHLTKSEDDDPRRHSYQLREIRERLSDRQSLHRPSRRRTDGLKETMQEVCTNAADFLRSLFNSTELKLEVAVKDTPTECLLDFSGPDAELLQAEGGELLQALQHLVTQAFGRQLEQGQRIVCDVEGFARRAKLNCVRWQTWRLSEYAQLARLRFRRNELERKKIIHLTLAECEDLYTESVREGSARKLRVAKK